MLSIQEFGRQLIQTEDLDPIYSVIHRSEIVEPQLSRMLLAYWCFYHLGAAAHISEQSGDKFWITMMKAAQNTKPAPDGGRWPRASERRYFRGPKCIAAVKHFAQRSTEYWMNSLMKFSTEKELINHVRAEWPLFGPWIGFKIADMMERVVGHDLKFSHDIGLIYEAPREGLDLYATMTEQEKVPREKLYNELMNHFSQYRAPPGRDRPCGVQEVETILCKWKSHMAGRYTVGKDILEVRHALSGGWGRTADRLLRTAPEVVK